MLGGRKPVNPYEPPTSVNDRIAGAVRSFRVGEEEITTVFVEASVWTGIRTYARDLESHLGPVHRGPCQFEVGERDPPAIPNPASHLPSKRNQTHRAELNDSSQGYLCKRREWIPGKWRPRPDLWKVSVTVGFK